MTQCYSQLGVGENAPKRFRQRIAVTCWDHQTAFSDHLCQRTAIARHQGNAGGHRLHRRQTEALIKRGYNRYRALSI